MLTQKPKVLILCSTGPLSPRVYREINMLKELVDLTLIGSRESHGEGFKYIRLDLERISRIQNIINLVLLKLRFFDFYYWRNKFIKKIQKEIQKETHDLIIVHNQHLLPLAIQAKKSSGCEVVLNAHEYSPGVRDNKWIYKFFYQDYKEYLCRKYMPQCNLCLAVNESIAREYEKNFNVQCHVVNNAPDLQNFNIKESKEESIKMVHHGISDPTRKLENMILLMDRLDKRFTLDLYIVNKNDTEYNKLAELAKLNNRVNFNSPVHYMQLTETLNKYDIGIYMLDPSSFNCRYALPNKIFEFIQARLAVASWPSPEIASLVNKYNCGVISQKFTLEALANELNDLSVSQINQFKKNSDIASQEVNAQKTAEHYANLLKSYTSIKF